MIEIDLTDRAPIALLESISSFPIFDGCTRTDLLVLARMGTKVTVPAAVELVKFGHVGESFFLLLAGEVSSHVDARPIATFGVGDFFAEIALVDDQPRCAELWAATDATVLVLNKQEFADLMQESPLVALRMLKALTGRLRHPEALSSS